MERLRQQPGFYDLPELREPTDDDQQGFHICPYTLEMDLGSGVCNGMTTSASRRREEAQGARFI